MRADLVFCGAHQECAHNCEEISCLAAELVFREVPEKSVQRSRHTQRFWRPFLCAAPLEAIAGDTVRAGRLDARSSLSRLDELGLSGPA
jgi:hypothetical protein